MLPAVRRRRGRRPRSGALLVAGLVLAALLVPAGARTARADADRPSLSLKVMRSGPATAPAVIVLGRAMRHGKPITAQHLAVQVRTTGTSRWKTMASLRPDRTGRVQVSRAALHRGKQFRIRTTDSNPVTSRVLTVPVATSISATAATSPTPTAGDAVRLSGTTSPGLAGARVFLQLLVGSDWRDVSSSVVASDATYSVGAVATLGGDQQYRALVRAAPGRPETASPVSELTVYAWYRLARTSVTAVLDGTSPLVPGREAVAGTPYVDGLGRVLAQGERASAVYDLHNHCLAFRTTYGPTSASDDGFYGVFRARADDDTVVDQQLDRGSVQTLRADITGASRLTLISAAATGSGDAGWGDPEVLCAGL